MNTDKKTPAEKEITVSVGANELKIAYEQLITAYRSRLDIPGFRRGMAPNKMIADHIGESKIWQEVIEKVLPQELGKVLESKNLKPIISPTITVTKFVPNEILELKAVITERPLAKLRDYKQIRKKRPEVTVDEKEIDTTIARLFEQWKSQKAHDHSTRHEHKSEGGIVLPHQESSTDAPKIQTVKTLKEAASKSETKQKDHANQDVHTSDDFNAFITDMKANDRQDLTGKVKNQLQNSKTYEAEEKFTAELLDAALAFYDIDIPDQLVAAEIDNMQKRLENQLKSYGATLEQYLTHEKKTLEQLRDSWKESAQKSLKAEFMLSDIAKQEGLLPTDEEITQIVQDIKDTKIQKQLEQPEDRAYLRHSIGQRKAIEHLKKVAAQDNKQEANS